MRQDGDVNARVWIRLQEIGESLSLLDRLLRDLPRGPLGEAIAEGSIDVAEGMAVVEAFRGDVLIWLRIANGTIER